VILALDDNSDFKALEERIIKEFLWCEERKIRLKRFKVDRATYDRLMAKARIESGIEKGWLLRLNDIPVVPR
jgi:hypothetical protein